MCPCQLRVTWSNGNTERIAKLLQEATGADLLRLNTAVPYEGSYDDVVRQGQEEVNRGYEPPLAPLSVDPGDYDVIAVGTPTWWYTMAPAVRTFLHSQNWSGKTVVPFMTNGGWPGHVIKDMNASCPGAAVACPMQVKFDSEGGPRLITPEKDLSAWAQDVRALL